VLAANDEKALAAVIRGVREWAVAETSLRANRVPVLALIGGLDPLKRDVDAMSSRLADMTTFVINGADHMTTFTRPEFSAELLKFLQMHPAN
jgi:pimeloyl-ACP methyl ester carboxylesterase